MEYFEYTVGKWAMIAAGAVVMGDGLDYALMVGIWQGRPAE